MLPPFPRFTSTYVSLVRDVRTIFCFLSFLLCPNFERHGGEALRLPPNPLQLKLSTLFSLACLPLPAFFFKSLFCFFWSPIFCFFFDPYSFFGILHSQWTVCNAETLWKQFVPCEFAIATSALEEERIATQMGRQIDRIFQGKYQCNVPAFAASHSSFHSKCAFQIGLRIQDSFSFPCRHFCSPQCYSFRLPNRGLVDVVGDALWERLAKVSTASRGHLQRWQNELNGP